MIRRIAALAALSILPGVALAATAASQLDVSATVVNSCSISNPATLAFGAYSGSQIDAQGDFTVTCNQDTAWDLTVNGGANPRTFANGPGVLGYELFVDTERTVAFTGVEAVSGVGNGAAQTASVFGRLPAGQLGAVSGAYTDAVAVTLTY